MFKINMKTLKAVSVIFLFALLWICPFLLLNAQNIKIEKCNAIKHSTLKHKNYSGFWDAILSFDTAYANVKKVTPDQKSFSESLKNLLKGQDLEFVNGLERLFLSTSDTLVRGNCYRFLYGYYFYEFQWNKFLDMDSVFFARQGVMVKDSETIKNDNLYKKLQSAPPTTFGFSGIVDTIPIFAFAYGSPVIKVEVNGKSENFFFDTGAGITSIFSNIVDDCNAVPVIPDKFVGGTGTNINIYFQYTHCNFNLGNLKISNSLATIQDYKEYEEIDKGLPYKINGILGWEIIKNLDVEIDYQHKMLIIKKPVKKILFSANLFYMNIPVITAYTSNGTPLYFGYDTGAGQSNLKSGIKKKVKFNNIKNSKVMAGSAGGYETIDIEIVKGFSLCLNNFNITFNEIFIDNHNISCMNLDGHFGGDIAQNGSLHFDYTNKLFEIKNNKINEK
jgi:hypothetical protein